MDRLTRDECHDCFYLLEWENLLPPDLTLEEFERGLSQTRLREIEVLWKKFKRENGRLFDQPETAQPDLETEEKINKISRCINTLKKGGCVKSSPLKKTVRFASPKTTHPVPSKKVSSKKIPLNKPTEEEVCERLLKAAKRERAEAKKEREEARREREEAREERRTTEALLRFYQKSTNTDEGLRCIIGKNGAQYWYRGSKRVSKPTDENALKNVRCKSK